MAAGITYFDAEPVERELYAVDSGYRSQGGFNLDTDGLAGQSHVPVLCPLFIDFKTRKAYVVNNLKVVEKADAGATSIKVQKGGFPKAGTYMVSSSVGITVSKVDTSNEEYDTLTVTATTADIPAGAADIPAGAVLTEATLKSTTYTANRTANALNYARTKIESGATVTALFRAYEIKEAELYVPVTEADKTSLTSRFMFV